MIFGLFNNVYSSSRHVEVKALFSTMYGNVSCYVFHSGPQDSPVKGGISILHTEEDGKHHYEVEKILKFKKGEQGGGAFAR